MVGMLKKNKTTYLRSSRVDLPHHYYYPLNVFLFRMEYTQQLNDYEHAKYVELHERKCLICSMEVKDQVGLEIQHISNDIIHVDRIHHTKQVCCYKCKKTYYLECVTSQKQENIKFSFLYTFNEYRQQGSSEAHLDCNQVVKQVIFLFTAVRQKTTKSVKSEEKMGESLLQERLHLEEWERRNSSGQQLISPGLLNYGRPKKIYIRRTAFLSYKSPKRCRYSTLQSLADL